MSDTTILQNSTHVIKPKKSVALSGVPAGNTALCTCLLYTSDAADERG